MYGFLDFVLGKEVEEVVSTLPYKATKKRVSSFERLNFIILPMFHYLENHRTTNKGDLTKTKSYVDKWCAYLQNHQQLNTNAIFEM